MTDFNRDDDGHALLPGDFRLDHVRQQLAGYHFAKEALSLDARNVLHLAELLLGELDRQHGGYAR